MPSFMDYGKREGRSTCLASLFFSPWTVTTCLFSIFVLCRYCMYYWFLTTATLCITMIFILVVSFWLFVFILWKFLSRQRESRRNQNGSTSHQASPIPDADSEVELDLQELEEEKEMRHEDDDGASLARMMHEHEQLLLNEDGDTKLTDPKDFLTTEPTVDHHDMDDEQFVPEPAL